MPRKSTKTTENIVTALDEALDTPLNLDWQETAEKLGLTIPELQERMSAKLDATVFSWLNIPHEHQPVIDAVARDLESEASVRRLEPQAEVQLPPVEEPPLVEEEPEAPKAKQSKRKSSALTKKKSEAIAQGRAASKQTNQGVKQVLAKLQAQEGIKDAANAGTTYLQAFQATLNQVKGEGLTVLAAEMLQGLSAESDFTPDEILSELGVSLSSETQQALLEKLTPVLGKSEMATQEILSTAWGNGIDLDAELSHLSSLLNSED